MGIGDWGLGNKQTNIFPGSPDLLLLLIIIFELEIGNLLLIWNCLIFTSP
ncbi:hypothetical protein N9414_15892 [Nodularia spumigena CCY9414]|nr:hypothetical protein N9414_15892 [Nodularia spumigena CCY9414]